MPRESRRLAAIVAADVVGFSRLVGMDEEGTLAALRAHRRELIDPLIDEHRGRIANTAGDSLLIEFPSVVDAVRCVVAVQEGMADRNRGVDVERQIVFRVGINVGDVVTQGADLLGDSVNIAARLEGQCTPGGIVLSDDAHRHVQDRLDASWVDAGDIEVKNIARPIRIWRWGPVDLSETEPARDAEPARDQRVRPSIAVLAFDNMSSDPDQEYFSDGIAEDVITSLSKMRWLFVVARNSSFGYKGAAVNVQMVGRELGVRYVLEGSVRRSADRVRITAQLIEAETGNHLWAERYDRDLTDVFEVQDEIATRIVSALDPAIRRTETRVALDKQPSSLRAWDHVLRGVWHLNQYTKRGNLDARQEFEQAIELDSGYARAIAWLSMTYSIAVMLNWTDARAEALRTAGELAKRARALDDEDPLCHLVVAWECFWSGRLTPCRHACERALALNPNSFHAQYVLGGVLNYQGESTASVRASETALSLSPNEPIAWHCMGSLAHAHYNLHEYEKVIEIADRAIERREGYLFGRILKTAALGRLGRAIEAERSLREITDRRPSFGTHTFAEYPFEIEEQRRHLIEGLHMAGLRD